MLSDYELWTRGIRSSSAVRPRPNAKGKVTSVEKLRARLNRMFFEDRVEPVSRGEYLEALEHHGHQPDQLEAASSAGAVESPARS